MFTLGFSEAQEASLASKVDSIRGAAVELIRLQETNPDLASLAGVEVSALEARFLLGNPVFQRRSLSGGNLSQGDLEILSRLEGVVTTAEARIGACVKSLEANESSASMEKLAGFIGLATGAVSLAKAIF